MIKADAAIYANGKSSAFCTTSDSNCMQYYTLSQCQSGASSSAATLIDARDGQTYSVRYINGNCWMTRNLAIGCNGSGKTYSASRKIVSLTSSDSNVSSSWSTSSAGELSLGNDDSAPRMACNATYGGYYNYAAATAGTITGDSNNTLDTYNICPKGWTMPTSAQVNTFDGTNNGSTTYVSAFSPVYSGRYIGGTLNYTGSSGYWWSRTANDTARRYNLYYDSSKLYSGSSFRIGRLGGFSVRCVRSS